LNDRPEGDGPNRGCRSDTKERTNTARPAELPRTATPGAGQRRQRLRALEDALDLDIAHHHVETSAEAERVGFRGSPTLLIDGIDPFASDDEPTGLACRVYDTPDGPQGAPTMEQLRRALQAAVDARSGS